MYVKETNEEKYTKKQYFRILDSPIQRTTLDTDIFYQHTSTGRQLTFILGRCLLGPIYFSQAFVGDYTTYAILRLILITIAYAARLGCFTLQMEMVGPEVRPWVCFVRDLAFPLGNILMGATAFLVRDWRHLHLAMASPLLLAPLLYFVLPESVMWLMSKGEFLGQTKHKGSPIF